MAAKLGRAEACGEGHHFPSHMNVNQMVTWLLFVKCF